MVTTAKAKTDTVRQEARFQKAMRLSPELLEVLVGERAGTDKEKSRLRNISQSLKQDIHKEAVYLLTHTLIQDHVEARQIYEDIIQHRNVMVKLLKRNVSIQVAALDYMQNIRNILKKPTVMEVDKCREFAERAIIDETTNTYDKDILESDLETEIERAKRSTAALSLLFLDIDDLKKINDTHGHETGTDVIKFVSNCIKKNLRKYDSIYRYGGDEFVALLPRTGPEGALRLAQRIKARISEAAGKELPVTPQVSIGIAAHGLKGIQTKRDLLVAADTALYSSKAKGKNSISIYGGETISAQETATDTPSISVLPESGKTYTIKGIPLVSGYAAGKAFYYRDIMSRKLDTRDLEEHEVPTEFSRIQGAIGDAQQDIRMLREKAQNHLGQTHVRIFDVHDMMLGDVDLMGDIEKELQSKMQNAEKTVYNVFHQVERKFKRSDSTMLQDRAIDVQDVRRRVLRKLTGVEVNPLEHVPPRSVIFAKRLLPSDTIHSKGKGVMAIVTEQGGASSHAAIIARALGIPSISGVTFNMEDIAEGAELLIDGYQGTITVNPSKAERANFAFRIRNQRKQRADFLRKTLHKQLRTDGKFIFVNANVASEEDVLHAQKYGCDAIGLFRIEALYLQKSSLPSQKHLYEELRRMLHPLRDKEICIRLADLGGDKTVPYLNDVKDYDSALGLRGIRLLFRHQDLLEHQLSAILQLSHEFKLRVLVPMVSVPEDMKKMRSILQKQKQKLEKKEMFFDNNIKLGAMIETPAAVLTLNEIMAHSDFLSIGTNDLIQYVMAADRERLSVSEYYDRGNELVLDMVEDILRKADEQEMMCSLCGELAGDERFTERLLGFGLRHFSVLPPLIPKIKSKIVESFERG